MIAFALRFALLLAVLVQYSPMRLCALEQAALGASCHDHQAPGNTSDHEDVSTCGATGGDDQCCLCEQPKVVGHQPSLARGPVDCAMQSTVITYIEELTVVETASLPDPDPQRNLLSALQLPLLI